MPVSSIDCAWSTRDIPQIAEAIIRCGEECEPDDKWRAGESYYLQWLSDTIGDQRHYFHLHRNAQGEISALAGLEPDNRNPTTGVLHSVYVYPRYRRLGLGRLVVTGVIQKATALGYKHLRAETDNPAAMRLYTSLGSQMVIAGGTPKLRVSLS